MCEYLTSDYSHLFTFLNLIAIVFTLLVLCKYAIDTNRMANQAQESNLRPVILRSGFIKAWNELAPSFRNSDHVFNLVGTPIQFTILKNIATDISGYIVVDHLKYQFLFGNDISKIRSTVLTDIAKIYFETNWGWMAPNRDVYGLFVQDTSEKTMEPNGICITYRDIEGNPYYSIEDINFSQRTYRGKPSVRALTRRSS